MGCRYDNQLHLEGSGKTATDTKTMRRKQNIRPLEYLADVIIQLM